MASLDAELVSQIRDAELVDWGDEHRDGRALREHDDKPEAKPLPAADSAQARAPLVAMLGDRDAADTKGGAALFHAPLSRYFTRTVSAGGVCDVIVLRLKRYMGHCECQLNMLNSSPH